MSDPDPARSLLNAITAFYEGPGRAGDDGAAAMLDTVCTHLRSALPFDPLPPPCSIAASALLGPALDRSALDHSALATEIRWAAPLLHWRRNPNYTEAIMGAAFMEGYGYVEFIGPKEALFRSIDVRAGLLVLGPHLHYPPHSHPAEEIYHPLTEGRWRRGAEDWRTVAPGRAIHHAPMVPHETRATDHTLLALYCWRGDTGTEARLSA